MWFDDVSIDNYITKGAGTIDSYLHFGLLHTSKIRMGFWADDLTSATLMQTGRWYHLVGVFIASTKERKLYIDGDLDIEDVASGALSGTDSYPLEMGRMGSNYFDGKIDEVRIYNRALSAAEVKKIGRAHV